MINVAKPCGANCERQSTSELSLVSLLKATGACASTQAYMHGNLTLLTST